jgi:hypothetical protein
LDKEIEMKTVVTSALVIFASCGGAATAAVVRYEVAHQGLNDWSTAINALPGSTVEVRALVSYTGTQTTYGLGSLLFQPTVSNWNPAIDTLRPFVNNGAGGNTTTPIGAAVDSIAGQYGRILPWAAVGESSTSRVFGHVNTVSGTTYLRVARAYASSWIGGAGNTSGGGGVNIKQWAEQGTARQNPNVIHPPFLPGDQNLLVFKFAFTIGAVSGARSMVVDTPADGFGNLNTTTGLRYTHWYGAPTEDVGSIRETAVAEPAFINVVPAPGTAALLLLGAALGARRRR